MEITLLFMGDSLLFHLQVKQDSSSSDYQLFTSYFRGEEPKKGKKGGEGGSPLRQKALWEGSSNRPARSRKLAPFSLHEITEKDKEHK